MHWKITLCLIIFALIVLRLLKMFYNARTRDIYAKNLVRWGCDKKKVYELASLWRWDLRKVHNEMLKEVKERKAYYSVNAEKLAEKAREYDDRLDQCIEANRWIPRKKGESTLSANFRLAMHYWKGFV